MPGLPRFGTNLAVELFCSQTKQGELDARNHHVANGYSPRGHSASLPHILGFSFQTCPCNAPWPDSEI